jgi:hypothetical protein
MARIKPQRARHHLGATGLDDIRRAKMVKFRAKRSGRSAVKPVPVSRTPEDTARLASPCIWRFATSIDHQKNMTNNTALSTITNTFLLGRRRIVGRG